MTIDQQTAKDAAERISSFLWFGAALGIIGAVVALVAWPGTTYAHGEGPRPDGDAVAAYVGLAVYVVGQLLVLVAVIATGVKLGIRAAHDERLP